MAGPCGRRCPAAGQAFTRAWAPFEYDGTARRLVSVLKDRAIPPLAGLMAAQMVATAPADLLAGAAVVPVPADPGRRRRRGLDHTLLLARECSSRTGLPVSACLGRRPGPRQAGASRRSRLTAGRPAVEVVGPVPPVALLIDDVHTTGATLDSCAAALRRAGSSEVRALTYARASRRRAGNARSY
jgi:predicted amidophosphoribosyltransferase